METSMTGSCLCGAVQYEIAGAFAFAGHCHCSMCRKSHGSPFATWGILKEPGQFRWTAGAQSLQAYASSPGRQRWFCRHCGSPLASSHGDSVGEVVLATVDRDPGVRPKEHIFVGSKACWDEIADALPQHETWPPGMQPV